MKRIFLLQMAFILFALPAMSQGVFDEHFGNCGEKTACFYCGDTAAHYTKNFDRYIDTEVKNAYNNERYVLRNFNVAYEVYVDTGGCTCVVSEEALGVCWSLLLKDDIRKWLDNMPDWKPATRKGEPINSSVVVEVRLRNNVFEVKYVRPPAPKPKIEVPKEHPNAATEQTDTTAVKTE